MLKNILNGRILFQKNICSWQSTIKEVALPLLTQHIIKPEYVDAMINNINRLGSYMILMPGVAMPHSRPEDGSNETGLSLLVLQEPVMFPGNQEVWVILCLAAASSDEHIETIEAIANFLGDDNAFENLKNARSVEEISQIIT